MSLKTSPHNPSGRKKRRKYFFRKKRLPLFLFALAGVLLIAAAITGFLLYGEGIKAGSNARRLLAEYQQGKADAPSQTEAVGQPAALPTPQTYEGYRILGVLQIDKIGQTLPVLSYTDNKALQVSCCYLQGPLPGAKGNLVITGHDYANGSIFGKLNRLKTGDTVLLSTPEKAYHYQVYEIKIITADNISALNDYQGDTALTLMTCTDNGNRRLLVKCALIA